MYKIASNITQFKNDTGPVLDEEGKHVQEPIGCLLGSFRWPSDGVVVPADFFADDATFLKLVAFPGIDVFTSEDGKNWRLLEMEDVDGVDGSSPSVHPAPSPEDMAEAISRGIRVVPRTAQRAQERGPMNEVPADKVRAHLESMTSPKGKRRGRKQALDG